MYPEFVSGVMSNRIVILIRSVFGLLLLLLMSFFPFVALVVLLSLIYTFSGFMCPDTYVWPKTKFYRIFKFLGCGGVCVMCCLCLLFPTGARAAALSGDT